MSESIIPGLHRPLQEDSVLGQAYIAWKKDRILRIDLPEDARQELSGLDLSSFGFEPEFVAMMQAS